MFRTTFNRILFMVLLFIGSFYVIVAQDNELPHAQFISWHPSGEYLVIAGFDSLWLYDKDFSLLSQTEIPQILHIDWSPNGANLLVVHGDGTIPISLASVGLLPFDDSNDFSDFSEILEYPLEIPATVFGVAWSPDSQKFALVNSERDSISIYDLDGTETAFGQQSFDLIYSIDWHPDESLIAVEIAAEGVGLWDAETGEYLRMLPYAAHGLLSSGIHFNSDGSQLLAGTVIPASIHVWDLETGNFVFEPDTSGDVSFVRLTNWNPDDSLVIYDVRMAESCRFGGIVVIDTSTWAREDEIYAPIPSCTSWFDLNPDGRHLTVLGYDGYLYNWEIGAETAVKVEGIQFASIQEH